MKILIYVILFSIVMEGNSTSKPVVNYNCAVDAAYTAFHASDIDVDYQTVASFFAEENRYADAQVPMSMLQQILVENGLQAESVKYQSFDPENLVIPSILLIYPEGVGSPQAVGHYVYLKEVTEKELHLIDPNLLGGEVHVPYGQLQQIWEGHAIIIDPPRWTIKLVWFFGMFFPLIALYQLFLMFKFSFNNKYRI